jgi:hypothetical protein
LPNHDVVCERPMPAQHCGLTERPGVPYGNSTSVVEVVKY